MAKPKMQMPSYRAHLSRSGFDMSQSLAFTASTGMLLPVYSDFLNAGEKVSIRTNLFARTQPLVTPPMADVDVYLDWFFVPMTMLYTAFGQVRYQTNDFISSLYSAAPGRPNGGFPVLSSSALFVSSVLNQSQTFSLNPASIDATSTPLYYNPLNFECAGKSMFRMLDLLGFNPRGIFYGAPGSPGDGVDNPSVFPYKALAYQAIYQEYFRNDDYEKRDVYAYNWDRYFEETGAVGIGLVGGSSSAVKYVSPRNPYLLRYADYHKDYFQSIKPSPILSGMNLLSPQSPIATNSVLQQINNYLGSTNIESDSPLVAPFSGSLNENFKSSLLRTATDDTGSDVYANTSAASLRSLFAVEKLMRITGRAAKDYDSQVLAHFGIKVPHDVKHQLTHLRSLNAMLSIGEVVGTADTYSSETGSGSALGELAGKGYVSISESRNKKVKPLKWEAPVDGVLMCIFHAIPRLRTTQCFDRQNAVTQRTDLFIPEFDKLGMQPLYRYEVDPDYIGSSTQIGWQFRYQQYKRKYDRASHVFGGGANLAGINQYSSWVLSYDPLAAVQSASDVSNAMALKCPPTALNQIMAVPYQPQVNAETFVTNSAAEFYTDPFICDFRADVKKVSVMSPTGEPDLISL